MSALAEVVQQATGQSVELADYIGQQRRKPPRRTRFSWTWSSMRRRSAGLCCCRGGGSSSGVLHGWRGSGGWHGTYQNSSKCITRSESLHAGIGMALETGLLKKAGMDDLRRRLRSWKRIHVICDNAPFGFDFVQCVVILLDVDACPFAGIGSRDDCVIHGVFHRAVGVQRFGEQLRQRHLHFDQTRRPLLRVMVRSHGPAPRKVVPDDGPRYGAADPRARAQRGTTACYSSLRPPSENIPATKCHKQCHKRGSLRTPQKRKCP